MVLIQKDFGRLYRWGLIACFFLIGICSFGQEEEVWFYIRARDSIFAPQFQAGDNGWTYKGNDTALQQIFSEYKVLQFRKTYRNASKKYLHRTFFVRTLDASLLKTLLKRASHVFESGELIPEEEMKIFEPNDYGLTSTIGENLGAQVNLDYLDFLGVPKAWYYTTGNPDIIIGISDGVVDTTDVEFRGRIKMIRKSHLAKGHGYSVAESAAGTGNNAYGIAGICYDCSVMTTTFGYLQTLESIAELSRLGAKVINCSWGTPIYYQSAQDTINKMFERGTLVIATGGNGSYLPNAPEKWYYPASYDHVISISSGMHRYQNFRESVTLDYSRKDSIPFYYAENVRGYAGMKARFPKNDTLQEPYVMYSSTQNLNSRIDILGPANGVYRYGEKAIHGVDEVSTGWQTSGVAPLISGTVGLMFSLYPCLPIDEVASILKITSWNIDHIKANERVKGMYGSGMLQTGDAVEMVYQLYNENETTYIDDQDFSRWDFKLTALSKEIVIRNQKFTDSATLNLKAKHKIVLKQNTVLKPGLQGHISLKIDPSLQKECDLILRDSSIMEKD